MISAPGFSRSLPPALRTNSIFQPAHTRPCPPAPQITTEGGSPFTCAPLLSARLPADIPVLVVSGLLDATPPAALALLRRLGPSSRLLLGPWTHILNQQVVTSGRGSSRLTAFPVAREVLRFMLRHVPVSPAVPPAPPPTPPTPLPPSPPPPDERSAGGFRPSSDDCSGFEAATSLSSFASSDDGPPAWRAVRAAANAAAAAAASTTSAAFARAGGADRIVDLAAAARRGEAVDPRVVFFVMGEGRWDGAGQWPPPGGRVVALGLQARAVSRRASCAACAPFPVLRVSCALVCGPSGLTPRCDHSPRTRTGQGPGADGALGPRGPVRGGRCPRIRIRAGEVGHPGGALPLPVARSASHARR